MGSSLSSYFEVYHRLLARSLELAAGASSSAALERTAGELAEACASSQHTYAHAQHILSHLASCGGGGGPFRRLSQELEAAAAARHRGPTVWAMQPLVVPRSAPPRAREAVRLVSSALCQGLGGDASGGGMLTQVALLLSQLQELYGGEEGLDGPTLEPLRHPKMLQLLLEGGWRGWLLCPTQLLALCSPAQGLWHAGGDSGLHPDTPHPSTRPRPQACLRGRTRRRRRCSAPQRTCWRSPSPAPAARTPTRRRPAPRSR